MSIVTRIFTLIAFTLLLVAGGELFNGWNLRQKRLEELRSDTVQLARIAELDMVRILEGTHQLLATLAKLPAEHGWDDRACSVIGAIASSDFEYDHLVAVDRNGTIQCSSGGPSRVGNSLPDRELLERIAATGGFSVGSYGVGQSSGNEVIRVGYPVVDDAGTVIGAVYAGINVTWLNTALSQWELGEKASIVITDRNGIVIARHPDPRGVGQPIAGALKRFLSASAMGTTEVTEAGGIIHLFGYVPVYVGPSELGVFVGRDRMQVFADINRSMWLNVAVILTGLLLSAAIATIYVRRFLSRPFQSLLTVSGRWRDGDWSARTGAASGIPEFDRLALAFDGMATEVSTRDGALQAALKRIQEQLHLVGVVSRAEPLLSGDVEVLARQITEEAARVVGCERVNAWLFNDEETELRCIDLYEASSGTHSAGMVLQESEYRAEFQALKGAAYIAADDPLTDPRTAGYVETYLKPLRITSMLDTVITVGGRHLGLLCFEHVSKPHHWEQDEIAFGLQLADKIGFAITSRLRRIEEEKRRISEAALAEAQKVAHLGSWSYEPQSDIATYSEESYRILGVDPATFNRSYESYLSRIHPDDRAVFECAFAESVANHTSYATDYRMLMDDGRVKWIHDIGRNTYDAVGRHVRTIGTMQDITERKKSEEALAESELKFRTILNTAVDGIVLADGQTRTLVQCNRAFAAMIGYELEEIATLGVADLHPNEALPEVYRRFQRMLQGEAKVASELPIKRKDGSIFFADMSGSPMSLGGRKYLVAVFHDVSERRQAAQVLRQERDFTTAVIDSLPGLFVLIDEKARIVRWNENLSRLTGISDEKLQGSDAFGIVIESDRAMARGTMAEAFARGFADVEFGVPAKNGDLRAIYFSGRKITSDEHPYLVAVGIDVTERKAAEEKLQFANTLLMTLRDTSPDAILVVDADQRIISFNRQFAEMWHLPPDLIEAGNDAPVLAAVASSVKDPDAFVARVQYLYEHPEEAAQDEVETADGRFLDRHTDVLRSADGRNLGRVWFFRDVTEAKRAEAKITQMARFDILTGLANRGVFVEALQQAIAWANRSEQTFAVLYLDLDHFKDVNDTLGHPIGDLLLQEVGRRLQTVVRETDTVARFGGDEFAVVLVGIQEPADAAILADKILKAIGDQFSIQGNTIRSGASVGIAVYGTESLDAESLLSHADVALYRAKLEGRGTYRFFTDAMDAEVRTRVTMGAELREAIAMEELFLLYQPQVEIETGRIVGLEALVRWRHPTRGTLGPGEFISVAEKSGLIVALGAWVMREGCRQTKQWLDAGIAPPSIGVNLSGLQFKAALELETTIGVILAETGVPPQLLELELTESVLMDASRQHNDVLIRLRRLGLRIAIDDFGTGYSSLDYLRRFPVDRIKIAQVFIPELAASENTAIVKAAIGLARALSIEVIVEGVETVEQLALLKAWGCQYVQGYYFAKPLSVTEATALLRVGKVAPRVADPVQAVAAA